MNISIAVVEPVFTSTPYSQYPFGSFYAFYRTYHATTGNITTNLQWLNTSVKSGLKYASGWGHTLPLYEFFRSSAARSCGLFLGKNVIVISDINVTQGALFRSSGSRMFDVVVIGHEEYLTQFEYDQMRLFVATGGKLISMSANSFFVKVTYNPVTGAETLVAGHGWAFNGVTAWHSRVPPFDRNSSGWFGSSYCCSHNYHYTGGTVNSTNPIGSELREYFGGIMSAGYMSHEENAIGNFTHTSIVATFSNQSGLVVASYTHNYGRGAVFCLCVFGEDLVSYDPSTQYFLVASVESLLPRQPPPSASSPDASLFLPSIAVASALAALAIPIIFRLRKSPNLS